MYRLLVLAAVSACLAAPAAAEVVWKSIPTIPNLRDYAAERALVGRAAQPLEKQFARPAYSLVVPLFQVDTQDPGGLTTLFAVRNLGEAAETIQVAYFDRDLNLLTVKSETLNPHQMVTVNVRDVSAATAAAGEDGIARGVIAIAASSEEAVLVGDYFLADPANNFATGDRMPDGASPQCAHWGTRFLNGGIFSGGTAYSMFIADPMGGPSSEVAPTVVVNVFNEAGELQGTLGAWPSEHLFEFTAADIVGPELTSGSLEFFIEDDPDIEGEGGYLASRFSASGRFSIGMDAVCITEIPME